VEAMTDHQETFRTIAAEALRGLVRDLPQGSAKEAFQMVERHLHSAYVNVKTDEALDTHEAA
jgi:hypothetical protein